MRLSVLATALFGAFLFSSEVYAADYAIAPFKVNGPNSYQYLKNAIPPMLNSRLFTAGTNEPVASQDALFQANAPTDKKSAEQLRQKHKADYLVYGTVNVIGDTASLDINVIGKNNYFWQSSDKNNVNNLLASVEKVAQGINQNVFKTAGSTTKQTTQTTNSSFIHNETGAPTASYLNPELRYQGTEENRARSQTLMFESVGMEIADFNNDGFNEVLLADNNELIMFTYTNNQLKELSRHKLSSSLDILRFRTLPYKGKNYIVVACYDSSGDARSYIFQYNNKKFTEILNSRYYLNVAKTSAHSELELVGQNSDATRFVKGSVFRVNFDGKKISKGTTLSLLPAKADVFNFTWIPSSQESGNVLAVLDDQDRLIIYNNKGNVLSRTDDYYASTGNRVRITRDIGGFVSQEGSQDALYHYIPNTINVVDLDNDNKYEIIMTKPLSVATNLLNNYRNYAQGEIQALVWDGVGLNLLWKTRRIKGTLADVKVADVNNDGVLDLVVNVNTYPGTLGVGKIRNFITSYPLQTDNVNTNAINFAE